MEKDKYSIPRNPFGNGYADELGVELREVEVHLRHAISAVERLTTREFKNKEMICEGARTIVVDAVEACTKVLASEQLSLIELGNVIGNSEDHEKLAKLQTYSNEVEALLVRLKLDAGLYGRRSAAYLRSILFVRAYGWQTIFVLALAAACVTLGSAMSKLAFSPPISDGSQTETRAKTTRQSSFLAVKAGQDLIASSNQTYEVFTEGTLLAREGSAGVARPGSTVIVASGAQAEVYGIAYAYNGATIILYPGGRVYAEPGAHVDNRGGELIPLKSTDWPLRYRRL